jgi:hypothetical protein
VQKSRIYCFATAFALICATESFTQNVVAPTPNTQPTIGRPAPISEVNANAAPVQAGSAQPASSPNSGTGSNDLLPSVPPPPDQVPGQWFPLFQSWNGSVPSSATTLSDSSRSQSSMGIESLALGEGMSARSRINYFVTWYPDEAVGGQGRNLGIVREDFNFSTPIYRDARDVVSFSVGVRNEILNTDALLPVVGSPFPGELWDIHFGTAYHHQFENGWSTGLNVNVGSASDEPFANINQITVGATGSLRIPVRDRDAWIFTLSFSNNSDFANYIPIPGIAYLWWPSDNFRALIGFPFANLWWQPIDNLTVDLSYRLLYTVTGRLTYRLAPQWKVYTGYSLGNESYFLTDLPENQRLFYSEQRVFAGVGWAVADHLTLDLTSGLAFDRFYSEGRNLRENQSLQLPVGSGPFISLNLQWRF